MLEQPPTPANRNNLAHFLAGSLPPLAATIVGLWQILRPFVTQDHIGMLYIAMVACWIIPMAVWVWCKVDVTRREAKAAEAAAAERVAELAAQIDRLGDAIVDNQTEIIALTSNIQRSVRGIHCRLERAETARDTDIKEVAHLRRLVLEDAVPIGETRLRPV